jgi:hypothetical protein
VITSLTNLTAVVSMRLYCILLFAYPLGFRRLYAPQMERLFNDLCRDSLSQGSLWGIIDLWTQMLPDLVINALQEHIWASSKTLNVALMAGVVAVFQLIPFSVVLGTGASFPLSLAIIGLIGILLGPWAGAAAVVIGSAAGVMIAPHTAYLGSLTVLIMAITPIGTGLITRGRRKIVGIYLIIAALFWWGLFLATNGVPKLWMALLQPWRYMMPGILLLLPDLTCKAVRFLYSRNRLKLVAGLGYILWIGSSLDHSLSAIIGNLIMFRLPEDVWSFLTLHLIGAERGALVLIGIVIGMSMMTGLRRKSDIKSPAGLPIFLQVNHSRLISRTIFYRNENFTKVV